MVTVPLPVPMTTFCPQQAILPLSRRLCGSQLVRRWVPSGIKRNIHPSVESKAKVALLLLESRTISVEE
jgi:hypothetical protein